MDGNNDNHYQETRQEKSNLGMVWLIFFLILSAFLYLGVNYDLSPQPTQQAAYSITPTPAATSTPRATPTPQRTPTPLPPEEIERIRLAREQRQAEALARKWTYTQQADAMSDDLILRASILSENTVNLSFPYQGAQRGTLLIREHPRQGRSVLFSIQRGQILSNAGRENRINVRFDNHPAESWGFSYPADHSRDAIFLSNYSGFMRKMRSASVVRLEVNMYNDGSRIFEFQVGGFDQRRYQNLAP